MFHKWGVTIPKGRTKAQPYEQELTLTKGIIHRVEIGFPAGCRGYVYFVLDHREHQLLPTNPDEAFNGEGYTIVIKEHFPLTAEPYTLIARGWAPDAVWNHTITVRIGILPEWVLVPLKGVAAMFKKFFKLLGVGG